MPYMEDFLHYEIVDMDESSSIAQSVKTLEAKLRETNNGYTIVGITTSEDELDGLGLLVLPNPMATVSSGNSGPRFVQIKFDPSLKIGFGKLKVQYIDVYGYENFIRG